MSDILVTPRAAYFRRSCQIWYTLGTDSSAASASFSPGMPCESLADEAPQLTVGIVERCPAAFAQLRRAPDDRQVRR